jgi:phage shock protein PspC (stress-responsive transcriptional regulator)
MNTILLAFTVMLIGYSSYAMIIVRSSANPPLDENNPDNVFSLQYYLNREQYGDRPLVTGQYFNARPVGIEEGKATYSKIDGEYKVTNRKLSYRYDPKFTTVFPRMYSSETDHINTYIDWAGLKESELYETQVDQQGNPVYDSNGLIVYDHTAPRKAPGFASNLRFFFTYQLGHMYFRYFMWNFVGRQNDTQGHGDPLSGNWISGLPFIDGFLVGSEAKLPDEDRHAKSRNTYFFLPLLLGLFGLVFQLQRDVKRFWVVMLLFVFTGIAIVVYLNQTPIQPRERDYAYTGSFYAYAIWIGLGVMALYDALSSRLRTSVTAILLSALCLLLVPGLMAAQNWDDHNRSGRYTARDIAYDYLNSCAPNAILFTNGDNDTFPLWYAQEVEGIRTDVRVVNLMLLNMDWYIDQMKKKAYESDPMPITMKSDQYRNGTRDVVFIQERTDQSATLKDILEFATSDLPQAKVSSSSGEQFNYIPTRNFVLPVDTALVVKNGTVSVQDRSLIADSIHWRFSRSSMGKSELAVLDILANNNWKRPVYFASIGQEGTLGLEDYMQLEGFAYRLVPIRTPSQGRYEAGRVATEILYENLMNKFKYGNINSPDVYLDDFHVRTTSIIRLRTRFIMLADALISTGDTARAVKVLDRCIELTPDNKIPFDHTIIQIANAYYTCNRFEKGNALVKTLGDKCSAKLAYYIDQKESFIQSINDQIIYNFQIMQNLALVSKNFNQMEISTAIDSLTSKQYGIYTGKTKTE